MGKSRQDTADLNRYYTRTEEKVKLDQQMTDYANRFSQNNSPRDERLSYRASSIGAQGTSQGKLYTRMNTTTMFGGNKFHSGLSSYNGATKTYVG